MDALLPRLESYKIGLPLMPNTSYDTPDLQHISNCLRVLENSLLSPDATSVHEALVTVGERLVRNLIMTCRVCLVLDPEGGGAKAEGIQIILVTEYTALRSFRSAKLFNGYTSTAS